tara:strand:+ start:1253 stop:1462 length:210 start_codon:yes stop_codon:yes gene_type:complete
MNINININEQPGRLLGIFLIGPYLIYSGFIYEDIFLKLIGIIFIIYEIFWVLLYKPKFVNLNTKKIFKE